MVDQSGRSNHESRARELRLVGAGCAGAAALYCVTLLLSQSTADAFPWPFGGSEDAVVRVTPRTAVTKPVRAPSARHGTVVAR